MVLFLIFLWVVNRTVFRPLLRIMDGRAQTVARLQAEAEATHADAERLRAGHIEQLTKTNQAVAERLRTARLNAYRENRVALEDLRAQADADLASHRAQLAKHLDTERARFGDIIPNLVQDIDRRIRTDGHLL